MCSLLSRKQRLLDPALELWYDFIVKYKSQRYQFVKPSVTKQNFGLDGSSAHFTIGKGKVVPEYKISFVFIAKKVLFQDFLDFKNHVSPL